jgi:hypothetical protein
VSGQVVVDLVANPGCLELARLAVTSPARRLLSFTDDLHGSVKG